MSLRKQNRSNFGSNNGRKKGINNFSVVAIPSAISIAILGSKKGVKVDANTGIKKG